MVGTAGTAKRIAEACRPVVVETARRRGTIGYGKLARRIRSTVGLPDLDGHDHRLHDALDILSTDSYDEGQNLLLSVVVVREDDGMPGHGFYHLARDVLGAYPEGAPGRRSSPKSSKGSTRSMAGRSERQIHNATSRPSSRSFRPVPRLPKLPDDTKHDAALPLGQPRDLAGRFPNRSVPQGVQQIPVEGRRFLAVY